MRSDPRAHVVGGPAPGPVVEVVRSARRRRSSSARVVDGRVVVRVPAHLSPGRADAAVTELLGRLRDQALAPSPPCSLPRAVTPRPTRGPRGPRGATALVARADAVAARWLADQELPSPHVGWSHRMTTRWASCSVQTARLRVSHRLADAPDEVLDGVLLHELVHLVHPDHGRGFHALLDRDPLRAEVDAWLARRTHDELRTALGLA